LRFLDEHAALTPIAELRARLLLAVGQRQVDDVVRALLEERLALLDSDDVVRRSDQVVEISRHRLVVAERTERPYCCHGSDRTNPTVSFPARTTHPPRPRSRTPTAARRAAARSVPRTTSTCSAGRISTISSVWSLRSLWP